MDSVNPAVKRRRQCVRWLASSCQWASNCQCSKAVEADEAAAAVLTIPRARLRQEA